jgi:CRP-like cAMP-binding protein
MESLPIPIAKRRRCGYDVSMAVRKKSSKKKRGSVRAISAGELLRELPGAKLVTHEAGVLIFREGSKATNCYIITQGKVRIFKRTHQGENIPLGLVKPGEFLGEMAMLSGERRSASAVAFTRVKSIVIDHAEFVALLRDRHLFASRLSLQISTLLATRCHRLLRLIARRPEVVPLAMKKAPPIDVRDVLNRIYTLWAV